MNYPFWDVPHLGSGLMIAIIAIFHVMISHFAVGGGLWLPVAERKALREGRTDWMKQLKRHSKFFLVLTGVFGAVSGVGIWFVIGLTQPEATSTLIHNFVFGWAMEWVFFLVELTTIGVYYYTWDRIPEKLHVKVGWVYATASLFTLVIINGILTFMLTPGDAWLAVAGTGHEASRFWYAFFNPTYWPSLFLRIMVCISLAGIWALVTASRIDGDKQPELKTSMVKWSATWLVPSFVLMPIFMVWYLVAVPSAQRALLTLGISNIGSGTFSQVTRVALVMIITSATVVGVVYFSAYRSPRDFTLTHALSILMLGLIVTASGEYAREMLRKPYVVGNYMYSNSVRVHSVAALDKQGYLEHSIWLRQDSSQHWAQGEAMFRGQCGACHTIDGYRAMRTLMQGRDREGIRNFLTMLHEYKPDSPYRRFMPPLSGTKEEMDALADYLDTVVNKQQQNKTAETLHAAK